MNKLLLLAAFAVTLAHAAEPLTPAQWASVEQALQAPDRAVWRLDFRPVGNGPENPNIPDATSVESIRAGKYQRDIIHWRDGRQSEAWIIDGIYIAEDVNSGQLFFDLSASVPGRINLASWVAPQNFRQLQSAGAKTTAIFGATLPLLQLWPAHIIKDPGGGQSEVSAEINLDDATLQKVRVDRFEVTFTPIPNPPSELTPPSRFTEKHHQIRQALQAVRTPAVP